MRNLKVDDGRLIRYSLPSNYTLELKGNELKLSVPNEGFARVYVSEPQYVTKLSLVKYAVRGMIERLGGFPPWGWRDSLQHFVDRWSKYPTNYLGEPALEQICNGAQVVASLRKPATGVIGIEIDLRMYSGNLVIGGSQIIYKPEILQRIGISPFPLGRNPHAIYCFLHFFLTDAVNHAVQWQAAEMRSNLGYFLEHYRFGGMKPRALEG